MMTVPVEEPDQEQDGAQQAVEEPEDEVLAVVARVLARAGAYSILHPGCGTGRYSRFLAAAGFSVTAFDLMALAVRMAATRDVAADLAIRYLVDDPSLPTRDMGRFDGVFAPNILHLFEFRERQRVLRLLSKHLRPGGVAIVTVLSAHDERYGHGREIEPDTFEVLPGQLMHFYSEDELHYELQGHFHVALIEPATEVETDHLGTRREYAVLLACGVKRD